MTDRDRTTRWESGPQIERTAVDIDLGAVRTVAGIDLLLGPFGEDFPRGLIIEASEDGQVVARSLARRQRGAGVRRAFEAPRDVPLRYRFRADSGAAASDEADGERRDVLLVDRGDAQCWGRQYDGRLPSPRTINARRTRSASSLPWARWAASRPAVLPVEPEHRLPPEQGPMAMALVDNMMTNGVLVDYDCARNTAWVNRAVWTKYNFEQRRNMLIGLATVCETEARRLPHLDPRLRHETRDCGVRWQSRQDGSTESSVDRISGCQRRDQRRQPPMCR